MQLPYTACCLVYYINSSINFLLYVLCGGKFRKAFSYMFCGRCIKKIPHMSVSKTNSSMVTDTTHSMSTTARSSDGIYQYRDSSCHVLTTAVEDNLHVNGGTQADCTIQLIHIG